MWSWIRTSSKQALSAYLNEHFVWRLPADHRAIALTFDDGPHPQHTAAMLDLLARHAIPATFFLIGQRVVEHPELVRRIADEGHGLGGHTFSHREIVASTGEQLAYELDACRAAIRDASDVDTRWFRPPRGRMDLKSLRRVVRLGYRIVHWSRTFSDYRCDGSDALLGRLHEQEVRARDIVLLHDHNPFTVEMLATAIPRWKSQGVMFERL